MSDLRECKKRVLFAEDDPCTVCLRLCECIAAPPLTDDELCEALYDRYLAPLGNLLSSALGGGR